MNDLLSSPPSIVETDSSVFDYHTPERYKKQIRQRTHELRKWLPKSPGLQTAVMCRMMKKYFPNTLVAPSQFVQHYASREAKQSQQTKKLHSIVFQIHKFKIKKDFVRLKKCVLVLLRHCSIRDAAKRLQIHYTTLLRWSTIKEGNSVRKVSQLNVQNVLKFYKNSRISMQLPYKRYAKYYYLRSPLAVAYEEYVKEQTQLNCRVLSKTAVYGCLKGVFRVRKKVPFKQCLCDICVNNSLLIDALIAAGVKHLHRSLTENITLSFCPIETNNDSTTRRKLNLDGSEKAHALITEHNRDCIYRECRKCGAVHFQEALRKANVENHIDWSKIVIWHQWEKVWANSDDDRGDENTQQNDTLDEINEKKVKARYQWDKFRYSGTLARLLSLFTMSLDKLSVHMFNFRWQAFQFDECKKLLQVGDVLFIIDFAQNHSHQRQDEVQSGYFARKQTTMHPFIIYFVCEKCGHLIKDEVMIFSDEMRHDWNAVSKFFEKVLAHLDEMKVPIKRMIIFSDNAGSQYKNCKVFDTLSRRDVCVMHNYYGAKHGKAEADGAIGRLSQTIDSVVRSGQYELANSEELTQYCRNFLTVDATKEEMCCHYRRHFFLVNEISHQKNNDLISVPGTQLFHSVRNTGVPGIIEVRESSCFCEICFLNAPGECKNKRLVKNFRWACTSKSVEEIPTTVYNKHWHTTSVKYVRPKKTIIGRKIVQGKITRKYRNSRVKNAAKNIIKRMKKGVATKCSKQGESSKTVHVKGNSDRRVKRKTSVKDENRKEPVLSTPMLDLKIIEGRRGNDNLSVADTNVTEGGNTPPVRDLVTKKAEALTLSIDSDSDSDHKPLSDWVMNKKDQTHISSVDSDSDSDDKPLSSWVMKKKAEKHILSVDSDNDNKPLVVDGNKALKNIESAGSDSDDYETNMSLADFKSYSTIPERSPVSLRVRERIGPVMSEIQGGVLFNLDDYENPKRVRTSEEKDKNRSGKKVTDKKIGGKKVTEELMISGIDSLSRYSIFNSSNTSTKSHTVLSRGHCSITNRGGNKFSTPKRSEIANISQMSLPGLSPIPHCSSHRSNDLRDAPLSPDVQLINERAQKKTKNVSFKSIWIKLQAIFMDCITFTQLRKKIEEEESKLPPLPTPFGDYSVAFDEVDQVARRLVPSDTPRKFYSNDYVPVKVRGDGNCFFRALSRLVYGDEQYHLEMRCRIVMDCVKNIDKYTNHNYLMRGAPHYEHKKCPNIAAIYCSYSGVRNIDDRDLTQRGIIDVFKENTLRIRKNNEYSDIWHFHSAANVLNRKIFMIFPDQENVRHNLRVDMHRAFLPNTPNLSNEFCLMWTSVTYPPKNYNHIVPLLKRYIKSLDVNFF